MRTFSMMVCLALLTALTASALPTVDGNWAAGEWDSYHWFTDSATPTMDGYLTWDATDLYLGFNVYDTTVRNTAYQLDTDEFRVTFDVGDVGTFDSPSDGLYWRTVRLGTTPHTGFMGYYTEKKGKYIPNDRRSWSNDATMVGKHRPTNRYYEMQVPWSDLRIEDTTQDFWLGIKIAANDGSWYPKGLRDDWNYYPNEPSDLQWDQPNYAQVDADGNFAHLRFTGGAYGEQPYETPEPTTLVLLMTTGVIGGLLRRRRNAA